MKRFLNTSLNSVRMLVVCGLLGLVTPEWMTPAVAGPGAHGPNGEHLDELPAATISSTHPRLEAHTDAFELVAEIQPHAVAVMIDRYETNEPVLNAQIEVETQSIKAKAVFRPDQGDYLIEDAAFLKAISKQGEHDWVFTIITTDESDLLDARFINTPQPEQHTNSDSAWLKWLSTAASVLAAAALVVLAGLWVWRRRKTAVMTHSWVILIPLLCWGSMSMAAWAGPGAHGPNGEHLDDAPHQPALGSGMGRLADGSVIIPKPAQRRMGIKTQRASESQAATTTELPAQVMADPNASGQLQALHGGRIEPGPSGLPTVGQSVKKGDVLAYIHHHAEPYALSAQQSQLADIKSQRELAQQRVLRLEGLAATVARKDIDAARSEAQSLAEREKFIQQGLTAREVLKAPVSGVVAHTTLAVGKVVDARDVLLTVVHPSRMQIEARTADATLAPRMEAAFIKNLSEVTLQFKGAARMMYEGMLTLNFSVHTNNPKTALPLAVGQPLTLIVQTKERIGGVVLPAQALARNPSNEPIVWIKSGAERFYPQVVQFKPINAHEMVVTKGLSADNRVVVEGAALIAQIR